jgi:carbon monoxide dehydrogenase subunit G
MKLDLPLHLRLPLDEAWAACNDAGALAREMPGAAVVESDESSARGTLSVDLGWTSVAYRGAIRIEDSDPVARSITLRGIGQGEAGEGLGELSAVVVLREQGGETVAEVALEVTAEGEIGDLMSEEPATLAQRLGEALAAGLGGQPSPVEQSQVMDGREPGGEPDAESALHDAPEPEAEAPRTEPAPALAPEPAPIAPDIPEPQRLSPMEEVALAAAAQDAEDEAGRGPEAAVPGPSFEEPTPPADEPFQREADEPFESQAAEPFVPEAEAAAPFVPEPAEPFVPEAAEAVVPDADESFQPEASQVSHPGPVEPYPDAEPDPIAAGDPPPAPPVAELPKAPRTGSIPPPGWTPPPAAVGGGGGGKGKRVRAGRRAKGKPESGEPVEGAGPQDAAGSGGAGGLLAKLRGALKR